MCFQDFTKAFYLKTNDQMLVVYLASLIRSVVALHNLINNKISNRDAEKKEGQEKEEGKKEKKDDKEKKDEKDKDKEKEKADGAKKDEKKKWVRLSDLLSNHSVFIWMVFYFQSTAAALYVGLGLKVGLRVGSGVIWDLTSTWQLALIKTVCRDDDVCVFVPSSTLSHWCKTWFCLL